MSFFCFQKIISFNSNNGYLFLSILECQNLARQMVENNISPIAYSLQFQNKARMKNNTAEVLRNVKLLEQTRIIVCSPRDAKYELIQLVLDEVIDLSIEPCHEIMVLLVLRKLILQTRMCSHPVGLDV